MEYIPANVLSETDLLNLKMMAELTVMDSPGCESGFTVENDGVIWRGVSWENGTSIYSVTAYGATMSEVLAKLAEGDDGEDSDENERLEEEWMARRAAIYGPK
jgi:hypothetical protein